MIDEAMSLAELSGGMARCVRESILPHLSDAFARAQAEELVALLEGLRSGAAPDAADAGPRLGPPSPGGVS